RECGQSEDHEKNPWCAGKDADQCVVLDPPSGPVSGLGFLVTTLPTRRQLHWELYGPYVHSIFPSQCSQFILLQASEPAGEQVQNSPPPPARSWVHVPPGPCQPVLTRACAVEKDAT